MKTDEIHYKVHHEGLVSRKSGVSYLETKWRFQKSWIKTILCPKYEFTGNTFFLNKIQK